MKHPAPLIILEIANNHMGEVEHGLRIIRELAEATKAHDVRRAIKFQYRQLDTFIHPAYRDRLDVKYIKRFRETELNEEAFLRLKDEAERLGFLTVCTAFDEASVDLIEKHKFFAIKIASCSLTDWPLLERIAGTKLPIIASVGGSPLAEIDRVVSFFEHRGNDLSLMHCVAQYPTPDELLSLNQIDLLKTRYPSVPVGFSTHERPGQLTAVQLAVAKGATILERHVGVRTEKHALNAYSSTPAEASAWIEAALSALRMCGVVGERAAFPEAEIRELHALRRGLFVRAAVRAGALVMPENRLLAIPTGPGQYTANDMSKYADFVATADIPAGGAVGRDNAVRTDRRQRIHHIVEQVRDFIKESQIVLPNRADLEISHHYGTERYAEVGATLLNFVNRTYCKKAIVMLPGQRHPEHWHNVKEETFFVIHGAMRISLNGVEQDVKTGDTVLVEPGVKHWFSTTTGVIFEEISSTHVAQDSFYSDPVIMANKSRKTLVTYWIK